MASDVKRGIRYVLYGPCRTGFAGLKRGVYTVSADLHVHLSPSQGATWGSVCVFVSVLRARETILKRERCSLSLSLSDPLQSTPAAQKMHLMCSYQWP